MGIRICVSEEKKKEIYEYFTQEHKPSLKYAKNYFGLSRGVIVKILNEFGFKLMMKSPKIWTEEENSWLKENYTIGYKECANFLKRSIPSISNQLVKLNLRQDILWTKEMEDFMIKNYFSLGSHECAKILKLTHKQIISKAAHLGLGANPDKTKMFLQNRGIKNFEDYKVNPIHFLDIKLKEVAFVLGLFWADGNIRKDSSRNFLSIECVAEDLKEVIPIFESFGVWNYSYYTHNDSRRDTLKISTCNRIIWEFLEQNDYGIKSKGVNPNKILSKIPEDLKRYWFLGFLMGDGTVCLNYGKKPYIGFAAPVTQDWKFIEDLCKSLDINYSISRRKNKPNKRACSGSWLSLASWKGCIKLGSYLFKDFENHKMGFFRKFDKFLQIQEKFKKSKFYSKIVVECFDDMVLV